MKGKMLVYPADNAPGNDTVRVVTEYDGPIPYEDLSKGVGGYIETVPYWDQFEVEPGQIVPAVAWCNEEGKISDPPLPRNLYMTDLWQKHLQSKGLSRLSATGEELDYLVGSIVIVTGDAEFLKSL